MTPYYADDLITLYCGDAQELFAQVDTPDITCLVIDPPYDQPDLMSLFTDARRHDSELIFTDPRHIGDVMAYFGAPRWLFTWDTMSPWNVSAKLPLTQVKFCAWYGSHYNRDGALWGDAPDKRDHPTTKFEPLDGRRLTDVWRQSLRWLHHPQASTGQAGSERFSRRQAHPAMRHAKPDDWVRCLIGNTTTAGTVLDPFAGSGTTLRAAKQLGRRCVAVEIDEANCEYAAKSLDVPTREDDQLSLFEVP